ncbi:37763_t:CDS:1, partial [Gigaspora margarita]
GSVKEKNDDINILQEQIDKMEEENRLLKKPHKKTYYCLQWQFIEGFQKKRTHLQANYQNHFNEYLKYFVQYIDYFQTEIKRLMANIEKRDAKLKVLRKLLDIKNDEIASLKNVLKV